MDPNTDTKTDAFADGVVTVEQAMLLTSLSRSTIYSLIGDGRVTTTKVGRRRLLSRSDLMGVLRAGSKTSTTTASGASAAQPTTTTTTTTSSTVDKETR